MEKDIAQRIWDYIDGACNEEEKSRVAHHLRHDPDWRKQYDAFLAIHEHLLKEEPEIPSLRFTKNVMEEISRYQVAPATTTYINKNIILSIGAFFLLLIAGLCIYFLGQIRWSDSSSGNWIPAVHVDAGKLNWSKLLNNGYVYIFLGINIMLGLILLDQFIRQKKDSPGAAELTGKDTA